MAINPAPYVGPRPFNRKDEARFFGREREANEVLSLTIAHPLLLLYAESGAGKTSLLNARVIPLLEAKNVQVFGPARVGGALPQWIKHNDVKNIYTFNALLSIQGDLLNSPSVWNISFSDFMETQSTAREAKSYSRRVVVFDQFEEIFSTHPERWEDRDIFFESVGVALDRDPSLGVIFAIREEYVARMDPFAAILPERLRTRFRLERLREKGALMAVTRPLEGTGYSFAPGAAAKLVSNLLQVQTESETGATQVLGEFVEPVQLQVVCNKMWQSLPSSVRVIDESYIKHYGDANKALASYYDACIKQTAKKSNIREGVLRRWFGQKLITPDRTRGTVYKDSYTDSGLSAQAIAVLEDLHLVRAEMRGGAPWYELTHDRFIIPIIQSNEEWFNRVEGGKSVGQRLEEKAKKWWFHAGAHQTSYLLKEGELEEATRWLDTADAEDFGPSETLVHFVQASHSYITKRVRRQRNILGLITAIALVASLSTFWLIRAHIRATAIANARVNGKTAQYLSDVASNEFTSVEWGLLAFEGGSGSAPPEAVDGLRAAIKALGNSIWLKGIQHPISFISAKLSATAQYAVGYTQSEAFVWKTDTGDLVFETPKNQERGDFDSATVTPDGKRLITTTVSKAAQGKDKDSGTSKANKQLEYKTQIWDTSNNTNAPLSFTATRKSIVLNDERHVLIAKSQGRTFVVDAQSVKEQKSDEYDLSLSDKEADDLKSAVIWPNESRLIIADRHGDLTVWDLKTGLLVKRLFSNVAPYFSFMGLHLSAEQDRLAFIGYYWERTKYVYRIHFEDLDRSQSRDAVFDSDDYFRYSSFSHDGKKFIVLTEGDDHLRVSLWDVDSGSQILKNRESTIKTSVTSWHNEVGMFVYKEDEKQLVFEDYETGETSTLLTLVPKYCRITTADLSSTRLVLASIENSAIYIRKAGSEMLNVDNYSSEQLRVKGCELLRGHPEFDVVESVCNH